MNRILRKILYCKFDVNTGYRKASPEEAKLSFTRDAQYEKISSALGKPFADDVWNTAMEWAIIDRDDYFERGFCLGGQLALAMGKTRFS